MQKKRDRLVALKKARKKLLTQKQAAAKEDLLSACAHRLEAVLGARPPDRWQDAYRLDNFDWERAGALVFLAANARSSSGRDCCSSSGGT